MKVLILGAGAMGCLYGAALHRAGAEVTFVDVNQPHIAAINAHGLELAGKIAPGDLQGGCFSISSLGGIGGSHFTPIINAPEVAILGVAKSVVRPVWNGKGWDPRQMLPISVSYDHRVIDGAQGARFISFLSSVLSDIRRLVL